MLVLKISDTQEKLHPYLVLQIKLIYIHLRLKFRPQNTNF